MTPQGCDFTLVCFDIADDRRRRRVVRVIEAFGVRAQESVFEAWLDRAQRLELRRRLLATIDRTDDRVAIYVLPPIDHRDIVSLGRGVPAEQFIYAVL
jgi:CRISPR-associated protein Cas2